MEKILEFFKRLLFVLMVGAFYYAGGYCWMAPFTKDEKKRNSGGLVSILFLLTEIGIFISHLLVQMNETKPDFSWSDVWIAFVFIHVAFCLMGMIIYCLWSLVMWILPKKDNDDNHYDNIIYTTLEDRNADTIHQLESIRDGLNKSTAKHMMGYIESYPENEYERIQLLSKGYTAKKQNVDLIYEIILNHNIDISPENFDKIEHLSLHQLMTLNSYLMEELNEERPSVQSFPAFVL